MKRSVPLAIASLTLLLEAGMDGMTPWVSPSVTQGGDECLTTMPLSRPARSARSAREASVHPSDSQWMITGHEASLASSIPLRRTLSEASRIPSGTGKCGLPTSPMATALPSRTSLAASSMPSIMISSARSRP